MNLWQSPDPHGVSLLMREVSASWWIAGGWAIELFVGYPVREHSDLEIGCFRSDVPAVLAPLRDWDIQVAKNKQLEPFALAALDARTPFSLWCRPRGNDHWVLEVLIEDREGDEWIYRRDRSVRRSAELIAPCNHAGLPYLMPEIQLLYKSKAPRPKDDSDFEVAWPLLDTPGRQWLADAIRVTSPSCAWKLST